MNEFTEHLKNKQMSTQSIQSCEKVVQRFTTWLDRENLEAEQVGHADLLLFIKHTKQRNVSQRTIQNYMNHVRLFYDYLQEANRIGYNPATSIDIKGVKRKMLYYLLEPTELNGLYNNYPSESLNNKRSKVILGLLVYQGLKAEELAKLEIKDIKLREGMIKVPGGRKGNGREMQLAPQQVMDMYDYVLQVRPELMGMKSANGKQEETTKLFIGKGGTHSHFGNLMAQVMARAKKLNKHLVNAKQIRASVITKWLKKYNLREVQHWAGHRYVSTTEGYKVNDLDGLQEQIDKYHPMG